MKMKKSICNLVLVLVFLVVGVLFGCNSSEKSTFKELSNVTFPSYDKKNVYLKESNYINESYQKLVEKLYEDGKNMVYSPTSLYFALSMLAEGTQGNSYDELMSFLQVSDLEELRNINKTLYNNNYYNNKGGQANISNSIWFDKDMNINKDYVKTLEENYYASSFQIDFNNDKDIEHIIDWLNKSTNKFLKLDKDNYKLNLATQMVLLNTIYFKNNWEIEFDKKDNKKQTFNGYNGSEIGEFMTHTVRSSYYKDEDYELFCDRFANNNMIYYILPSEGRNVRDYLGTDFLNEKMERVELCVSLPKFKFKQTHSLTESLKEIGIKSVFIEETSKIATSNIVSNIEQIAGIEFSEKGVEAAAVTTIENEPTSIEPLRMVKVMLNRPFIYYIVDNSKTILFSGVVNQLAE